MAYNRHWQENSVKNKNEPFNVYQNKHEQMSKQQQLIEQKKQEIQKKLEEKKKKEIEDALKKLNEGKSKSNESSLSKRSSYGSSRSKQMGRERIIEETLPASMPANIFSNDGSFLEQFQKISGIKVEVRKKSVDSSSHKSDSNTEDLTEGKTDVQNVPEEEKRQETEISSPKKNQYQLETNSQKQDMMQQMMQQQAGQNQHQQNTIQHQQAMHQHQQPVHPQHYMMQQRPMFTPQPPMPMNFPSQFNAMQCGMMIPPPMTPSSIPPPAPLNPGSIPSPSPLQPCSIPSPSPLQPYAIPPPSPLLPHSIPPPSPMVPHSIPPPSPLTPHSIPPPLPLRPQSIPPPLQQPPLFLSMVPPPPPPPLPPKEEEKSKETSVDTNEVEQILEKPKVETNVKIKSNIEENVKDLFKNDDYSSSSEDEDKDHLYDPSDKKHLTSDSESEPGQKSIASHSDKESDVESDRRVDSTSEMDSFLGQESRQTLDNESYSRKTSPFGPIVIEDSATQFPSDTKDSSNIEDAVPPDLSSDGETLPLGKRRGSDSNPVSCDSLPPWQKEMKKEPEDMFYKCFENTAQEDTKIDVKNFKQEVIMEVKEEDTFKHSHIIKQETFSEAAPQETNVKSEEPVPKKKRKSRWASSEEKVEVAPVMTLPMPPMPPAPSIPVPGVIRPPALGPIGMAMPIALGGVTTIVPPLPPTVPIVNVPGMSGAMISKVTRTDAALVAYAMKSFGHTNLTDAEWKKAEDHYKINLLYQDMMKKKEELQRLEAAGKHKYEYDSDEETEGGTWEHKLRSAEMEATQRWADELTEQAKGKHHIGDFLPPDELSRFMEKYEAMKDGREPDLSDYKEFKLKEDNIGFQMLQKLGWTEGQGLGPDGAGIMDPVNKAMMRPENQGLGVERPEDVDPDDDEYDAYRKRMMLAYRFRPNPMNNPRRPYY